MPCQVGARSGPGRLDHGTGPTPNISCGMVVAMSDPSSAGPSTISTAAARIAALLAGEGLGLSDARQSELAFETDVVIRCLDPLREPADVWAIDGGQALVADARCLQLYVTRSARVRWQQGRCVLEEDGELRPHLLGCGEERATLAALRAPVTPASAVDVNLLRDWGEWEAVASAVEDCDPGGAVLLDGDLQPDWRISASWLGSLFERAASRNVLLAGITKHSSLARGGAPLLGQLEREAAAALGERATWWAKVATTRPDVGPGLQVLVARMDPDARFAFRVDLPDDTPAANALGALASLCTDAGFPGYPYPLTVADRLAACPSWVRHEVWDQVQDHLDLCGVAFDVRERAFADRHRLMERA